MTPERTELEWIYLPADLFEAQYHHADGNCDLLVNAGRAVATLRVPQDPVSPDVGEHVKAVLERVFLVRQFEIRREYSLKGPRTYQHAAGRKNVSMQLGSVLEVFTVRRVDLIATDAAGNIMRDSRAERIAADHSVLDSIVPKLGRSATLRSLFASHSRSITDLDNELVYLYEIRDALCKHYGREKAARDALRISKDEWRRLGDLANHEPLEQGRHRGKHPTGRRAATESELHETRQLVQCWIMAFAQTV